MLKFPDLENETETKNASFFKEDQQMSNPSFFGIDGLLPIRVPGSQIIDLLTDQSDSEVDSYVSEESDIEGIELISIEDKLLMNRDYFDQQKLNWQVQSIHYNDQTFQLIKKPTASKLNHRLLHPALYRQIQPLYTLNDFASLIGCREDWEIVYNEKIKDNSMVIRRLNSLRSLPQSTREQIIEDRFFDLITCIALTMQRYICLSRDNVVVGGLMARHEFDYVSYPDPSFTSDAGKFLLASEIKTLESFRNDSLWYHSSRSSQVLAVLFARNCPTFLFNQNYWKVFAENSDRNQVFSFPFGQDQQRPQFFNSVYCLGIGQDFLKALTICLLQDDGRDEVIELESSKRKFSTPIKNDSHADKKFKSNMKEKSNDLKLSQKSIVKQPVFKFQKEDGSEKTINIRVWDQELFDKYSQLFQDVQKCVSSCSESTFDVSHEFEE